MPRDLTAWSGAEGDESQFRFHLLRLELPSPQYWTNLDESVYFNVTTEAGAQLIPGAGRTEFVPEPGLAIKAFDSSLDSSVDALNLTVSNASGDWFGEVAAGTYRFSEVTLWEGRISLAPGAHPDAATILSMVKLYAGQLIVINAATRDALLRVERHLDFRRMKFPQFTYDLETFTRSPEAGYSFVFGFTMREV